MADEARVTVTLDDLLRLQHRAKGFSFLPKQPVHSLLAGRHASRLRGRGLEFEELRPYYEGEERDRSVILLVDQRLGMFFGSRRAMKSVVAAEAAALAAWRVTSLGDRIGGIVFSENGIDEIRPRARRAAIDPRPSNPSLLNAAISRALRVLPHDGLLTLITDGAGANQETVRLITEVTAHNDALVVFVFDPLEEKLPGIGPVTVAEGGRQIEADISARTLQRQFAEDFSQRRRAVDKLSRRRAIPVRRSRPRGIRSNSSANYKTAPIFPASTISSRRRPRRGGHPPGLVDSRSGAPRCNRDPFLCRSPALPAQCVSPRSARRDRRNRQGGRSRKRGCPFRRLEACGARRLSAQ